jgi:hypothetical protein
MLPNSGSTRLQNGKASNKIHPMLFNKQHDRFTKT